MSCDTPTIGELWTDGPAASVRLRCRNGELDRPTAGLAGGFVQANLVVIPHDLADDFEAYCHENSAPCPLLERLPNGDPRPARVAAGADVRTDLPRYRVHRPDDRWTETTSLAGHFARDAVAFLLGCSFSFELALTRAGLTPRNVEEGVNVPMYRTTRATRGVGAFGGPLVVSMRPVPRARVDEVYAITRPFTHAHGAPVHHGTPAELGIDDLSHPDFGDAVAVREDEVPVFWACGVTSQEACRPALRAGLLPYVLTHAPGYMFLTDLREPTPERESAGQ